MIEKKLSTNKSLTSDYFKGLTKNISKNPFEDKKKKYGNRNKPLTQEQVEVFKQAFEIFDSNKSGTIDQEELKALLAALGYQCTSESVRKIMQTIDQDGSGVIQMEEFILFMSKHMLSTDNLKRQMTKIFDYFDEYLSGYLDHGKIKKMVSQSLFSIDDEAIQKMIQAADTDGSGKISKNQFLRVMKKVKLL